MEKHFDLKVFETKQKLINVLNESQLPLSVMQMVVNEISNSVNTQFDAHIQNLQLDYQRQLQLQEQATSEQAE